MQVLMEVLQDGRGSIGYGGKIVAPGERFECRPEHVEDLIAARLAKPVDDYPVESTPAAVPAVGESVRAQEREALFAELAELGITASQKTNTKTLRLLVERAKIEPRR
jgi:hypothetical protein